MPLRSFDQKCAASFEVGVGVVRIKLDCAIIIAQSAIEIQPVGFDRAAIEIGLGDIAIVKHELRREFAYGVSLGKRSLVVWGSLVVDAPGVNHWFRRWLMRQYFARYRPFFTEGVTLAAVGMHGVGSESVLPPTVKHRVPDPSSRLRAGPPAP